MAGINDQELDEIYAFAIQLGKDAGRLLMSAAQSRMQGTETDSSSQVSYVEKENSVDLVTKTDNGISRDVPCPRIGGSADTAPEVEEFIRTSVLKKYPNHAYDTRPFFDRTRHESPI